MDICISNYKNILELNYHLEDNKINYLFGISGSGKSSIPSAIVDENLDENRKFGENNEAKILINGILPQKERYRIYNETTISNYFNGDGNDFIYPILIDDDSEYIKAQKDFCNFLSVLESMMNQTRERYIEISLIVKNFGATSLTKNNTLRNTSQLLKIVNSFDDINNKKIYKEINDMPDGKFSWVLEGIDYKIDNKCPFCDKIINNNLNNKLINYKQVDAKSFKTFKSEKDSYERNSGKVIKYTTNSLHTMMENVIDMSIACKTYEMVLDYINKLKKLDDTINNIKKISIDNKLYLFFPELKKSIEKLNDNFDELKKKYDNAKKKTSVILNRKTKSINNIINQLGIPYKISAKYNQGKITDYKLVHNDDEKNNDSRSKLSNGEKNIISLIFFILTVSKLNDVITIIDDPVSSYDECRRKLISNLIISKLAGKTTLILSHDCVFAKYAALETNKYVGTIYYLENFNGYSKLVSISKEDFGDFNNFVIERIQGNINYYIKIVNLRMLYEGKNASDVYGYLSALLHGTPTDEITLLLNEKGKTEKEILLKIKEKNNIELEPMFDNYYKNINTDELSFFEKALFLREYLDNHTNIDKTYKKNLDDFIHLNSRLLISLNPYKYAICTPRIYNFVTDNVNGILSVRE